MAGGRAVRPGSPGRGPQRAGGRTGLGGVVVDGGPPVGQVWEPQRRSPHARAGVEYAQLPVETTRGRELGENVLDRRERRCEVVHRVPQCRLLVVGDRRPVEIPLLEILDERAETGTRLPVGPVEPELLDEQPLDRPLQAGRQRVDTVERDVECPLGNGFEPAVCTL